MSKTLNAKKVFDDTIEQPFEQLRRLPLSFIDNFPPPPSSINHDIYDAQSLICTYLSSKKWLLDTNQTLPLPTLSLKNETKPIFTLSDFVIEQDFKLSRDVLESAVDPKNGNRLKPSAEQMDEIQQFGRLSVPSRNFKGQNHVWEVSGSFYLGIRRKYTRFQNGLGKALDHLVVMEQDALMGYREEDINTKHCPFSVRAAIMHGFIKAVKHLWESLHNIMLWTRMKKAIKYRAYEVDKIIKEAERLYINHGMRKKIPGYVHGAHQEFEHGCHGKWKSLREDSNWDNKYIPETESHRELRLEKDSIFKIRSLHKKMSADLAVRRAEELDVKTNKIRISPQAALQEKKRADVEWCDFEQKEIIEAFQKLDDDPILRAEAGRLYCKRLESTMNHNDRKQRDILQQEYKEKLQKKHWILSTSPLWIERQLSKYDAKIYKNQQNSFEARLLKNLYEDENSLATSALVPLKLQAEFLKKEEPCIRKTLSKKRVPYSPAVVNIPRLYPEIEHTMYNVVKVPYETFFWRAKFYVLKFIAYIAKLSFGPIRFLLSGPLSLKALFCLQPFVANDGKGRKEVTPTLTSRLKDFFETLDEIKLEFEGTPDLSLIGKNMERFLLYKYLGFKKIIGSVIVTTFMVLGTSLMTILSLATLVFSPILAGLFVLMRILTDLFIYDYSGPCSQWSPIFNIVIGVPYYLLVPGVCQTVIAVGCLAFHPIIGLMQFSWSVLRFMWSSFRCWLVWPIIRRNATIPAADTFLAKRVQGPGLASAHFYRMPLQAAFEAVQAFLDYSRMRGYVELRRIEILSSASEFELEMQKLVKPFGFSLHEWQTSTEICRMIVNDWEKNEMVGKINTSFIFEASCENKWNTDINVWDNLAYQLRAAHPNYQPNVMVNDKQSNIGIDFMLYDKNLDWWVNSKKDAYLTGGKGIYGNVAETAGVVLSKLVLLTDIRKKRLLEVCSLPPAICTRFRLSEEEIQVLWTATISLVQQYADNIHKELHSIAKGSDMSEVLIPVASYICDKFWTDGGSRPGKDIEILASHILSVVFGGDLMLESMEQVDKKLLLIPKNIEDEHLDFFGLKDSDAVDFSLLNSS